LIKVAEFMSRGPGRGQTLFLITGEEPFLREEAVQHVKASMGDDMECVTYSGAAQAESKIDLRDLLDDLRMQDLFGDRLLIHVQESDAFVQENEAALIRFFDSGEAVQPLILEAKGLVKRGAKELLKTGFATAFHKAGGVVVQCDPLYDTPFQGRGPPWQSGLSGWVVQRARQHGKRLSMEDAYTLHRMVGNKLRDLDTELKKLALFVKERVAITEDDIHRCVGEGRLAPVFDIAEAAASRLLGDVLEQSRLLFERGLVDWSGRHVRDAASVAISVVSALVQRLRKVARVRDLMEAGEGFEAAAQAVRHPVFFNDRLRAQVAAWRDTRELDGALSALQELERCLKTGAGGPRVLLDRYLVEHVGSPGGRPKEARWRR
jgi:DNA polymerase III delta subunit